MLETIAAWDRTFRREHAAEAIARDPLRFARRYAQRADRELVALVSALLAFGKVSIVTNKLEVLLKELGPSPSGMVRSLSCAQLIARLRPFRHRTFSGEDVARLLHAAAALQIIDGSVFTALERAYTLHGDLRMALCDWVGTLRARGWPEGLSRGAKHLLPDPLGPSASKRLFLLLRWVVRPDDGIDLGLVAIPPSALRIPVDVHVLRIGRNLGLTRRSQASRRAAEEITDALRALNADDPVRYDMALCHLGISRRCPSRSDAERCEGCALQPVCIHWQ